MPLLKKAPPHEEVAFALGKLLSAAGMADNMQGTSVAAISGTRRPAYHLLTPQPSTKPVSEILTGVLARSFPPDHSGWLIDLREARAIIEAAHRLSKSRSRMRPDD
jgi:hypothetical protein